MISLEQQAAAVKLAGRVRDICKCARALARHTGRQGQGVTIQMSGETLRELLGGALDVLGTGDVDDDTPI